MPPFSQPNRSGSVLSSGGLRGSRPAAGSVACPRGALAFASVSLGHHHVLEQARGLQQDVQGAHEPGIPESPLQYAGEGAAWRTWEVVVDADERDGER